MGGEFFEVGLANMALFGRVAVCGATSQYNATEPAKGMYAVFYSYQVQWNLRIKDTLGAEVLSSFRRLSSGGRFEPIGHL